MNLIKPGTPEYGSDPSANALDAPYAVVPQSASAAIAVTQGLLPITKTSAAVLTLAAPVSGLPSANGNDGQVLRIIDVTGHAHTVTTPTTKLNGNKSVITYTDGTGTIKAVTVSGNGTGYTDGDDLIFSGGGGADAAGTISTVGAGYINADPIVFTGDGTTAAGHINVTTGNITSASVTAGGSGYTSAPTATVSTGSGQALTAVLASAGAVKSVTVSVGPGAGFTDLDPLIFSGGGGTLAAGHINVDGDGNITGVTMTVNGSGYTTTPTVAVTTAGGSNQTLTAVRSFAVATVSVAQTGKISSATVSNAGSGYTTPPTVTVTTGGGTGQTLTSHLGDLGTYVDLVAYGGIWYVVGNSGVTLS